MTALARARRTPASGFSPAAGQVLAGVFLSLLVGAAVGRSLVVALAIAALGAGACAFAVALANPPLAFAGVIAALAFVPYYAAPAFGPLLLEPAALGCWVLAAGLGARALLRREPLRLGAVDLAALAFLVVLAVAVIFPARGVADLLKLVLLWGGPFLAGRLLLARYAPGLVARAVAGAALGLAPLVAVERLTGANPFQSLTINPAESAVWAPDLFRFGQLRPEASFGHPIALAMFLATAAVLCVGLALDAGRRAARVAWLAAAGGLVLAQALTLSRSGWVVLVVGLGLLGARSLGRVLRPGMLAALAAVAAVVAFLPQAAPARAVISSAVGGEAGGEVADSGSYRERLARQALSAGTLRPFGNRESALGTVTKGGSIDNEYLLLADRWGLVPLAAFALIVAALGFSLAAPRGRADRGVLAAVALGNLAALAFVAFITQQQLYIWLLIGACAGLYRGPATGLGAAEGGEPAPVRDPARRAGSSNDTPATG